MRNRCCPCVLGMLLARVVVQDLAAVGLEDDGWRLDERPAEVGEWGFRPADGAEVKVTPPGFVWRPQEKAARYRLQVARDREFLKPEYESADLSVYYHCPSQTFASGRWYWRFQAADESGRSSAWSSVRSFTIGRGAAKMPLPSRAELRSRVPAAHPRLFLRPEDVPGLRQKARSDLAEEYRALARTCERLLKNPPPSAEPEKYPPEVERKSEAWRALWWGNRVYVKELLDSACTLAFVRLLDGNEQYGQLARRLLLDAAHWDPKGASGYRYNDEAGMPYAYGFSRAYSLVYDLLSEDERELCCRVMRIRGREMYDHLRGKFTWRPYESHANRAWHFLGEVGIAFLGEIPEAEDWLWFAMNVFHCSYPVWCDDDGGWHEGLAYWRSYMERFSWWADVMRSALAMDAYRKPYFSQIGYYPLYLQPPGTRGGGFGDLSGNLDSSGNVPLMRLFAAQAGNPHWQWYAQAHGSRPRREGLLDFIRGARPDIEPAPPTDLPSSRCFHGIGLAVMNSNLLDGKENVQVHFKSSPFGTVSHGYDANNAFLLYAFGTPLFISSGWRDIYGSDHHKNWMWHTKSTNCITVDGEGQIAHSPLAKGRILDWATTDNFDFVSGEAGAAYGGKLTRFTRDILFVKPELLVIHDVLEAKEASRFNWWLHSPVKMDVRAGRQVRVEREQAGCDVTFLAPSGLSITQTDQFDPPPRQRVKLTEYHLTASTPEPRREGEFITLLRPYRTGTPVSAEARLKAIQDGWAIEAPLSAGQVVILLSKRPGSELKHGGLATRRAVAAARLDAQGAVAGRFEGGALVPASTTVE